MQQFHLDLRHFVRQFRFEFLSFSELSLQTLVSVYRVQEIFPRQSESDVMDSQQSTLRFPMQ